MARGPGIGIVRGMYRNETMFIKSWDKCTVFVERQFVNQGDEKREMSNVKRRELHNSRIAMWNFVTKFVKEIVKCRDGWRRGGKRN